MSYELARTYYRQRTAQGRHIYVSVRPSVTSSRCTSPIGANYAIPVVNHVETQAIERIRTQRPGKTSIVRCESQSHLSLIHI
eukprot:6940480-Heterocapsa_arctica.AAC.1